MSDGTSQLRTQSESGATFVVYRQPIALDRFTVHDVLPPDTAPASAAAVAVTVSSNKPSSVHHSARSTRDQQRPGSADHGQNIVINIIIVVVIVMNVA